MIHPRPAPPEPRPECTSSILEGPEIEIKVKGSRFLARAFGIDDEAGIPTALASRRKHHHAASHHCWAVRIHRARELLERSDDDGEPSGTAGTPILGALQRRKVTEALCVVTRYFGGTKLGRGGLVRAYGEAARDAVEAAPARTLWHDLLLDARCGFDELGVVETGLAQNAEIVRGVEREFAPEPHLRIRLRRSGAMEFADRLYELTAARIALRFEEL